MHVAETCQFWHQELVTVWCKNILCAEGDSICRQRGSASDWCCRACSKELMEPHHNIGHNDTTDNYFTSLKTAKNFLQHGITMVGTLQKNKQEKPLKLHADTKQKSLYNTSRFLFTTDGIMILYNKAKLKKDAFLLSSMHTAPVVDKNQAKKKPEAISYYNSTKSRVDTADDMLRCYGTKAASRRWQLAAFFNLLDIISLNAFVIAKDICLMKTNRRSFLISWENNCVTKSSKHV